MKNKYDDLKKMCRKRGVAPGGKKIEMVARLVAADEVDEEDGNEEEDDEDDGSDDKDGICGVRTVRGTPCKQKAPCRYHN